MARYACSDFHGRYDLAELAINRLESNDHLFYLGDAIDRGPRSLDTLNLLINHPQVTFLLGNHEDMMFKAMTGKKTDIVAIDCYQYSRAEAKRVWYANGGYSTSEELLILQDRDPEAFQTLINKIKNARRVYALVNDIGQTIVLTHAGFTPGCYTPFPDRQLWNRIHIKHEWPQESIFSNVIIVHGHTPVQYLQDNFVPSPYWYCDNHKVGIDLMSAYSGFSVMLNLDTWKSVVLEGDHSYDL